MSSETLSNCASTDEVRVELTDGSVPSEQALLATKSNLHDRTNERQDIVVSQTPLLKVSDGELNVSSTEALAQREQHWLRNQGSEWLDSVSDRQDFVMSQTPSAKLSAGELKVFI